MHSTYSAHTRVQEPLVDRGPEAPDETGVGVGVLEALAEVCQRGQRVWVLGHHVEELADADAAHSLVHIVLQPLGPGA